ncbi:hypothetical protein QYF61_010757 [Mycteria americana]|uniref:Uncharacterized protein n=1 Tax=Mycteria americana TaxID=33587 RepID=A0AAN7RXE4_MYCAM|nr:hypothetical protein QYF61_010757 [Mycteria americana]
MVRLKAVPIRYQGSWLYPLPFPADLAEHQPGEKGLKDLMCLCVGVLDIRGNLFPMKTVKHWKRLPREVVQSPSLEVFKTQLDEALSNLV